MKRLEAAPTALSSRFSMLLSILAADFDFIPQVHHKRIWPF
ncbi:MULTISPECIES: hypothetical protein [Pseudomonas]|nr:MULTISPECIES: hypothetical protein [Pseudomonas]MDG9852309.1 hypothetical protein [Pseudomonas nitroreducens]